VTELLANGCSGRSRIPGDPIREGFPLVVAIHGGTYDSAYFDVPGFSLLDRAEANAIPIIALDRPGYGATPLLSRAETTLVGQARFLAAMLENIWRLHGDGRAGVVVIAHSIGAAISSIMASGPVGFPLIGLAVSGLGMRTPPEHRPMWESLPDLDHVDVPNAVKDEVMFGPEGSFDGAVPAATHSTNRPTPKVELVDIVSSWQDIAPAVLAGISVPVHYRQGEFDRLWINGAAEVADFERALTGAPSVDARMEIGMGHCLDFHRIGGAFQLEQLAFALRCAV
jgi:pimeloyl-ACP methyl ester carboxylesterase